MLLEKSDANEPRGPGGGVGDGINKRFKGRVDRAQGHVERFLPKLQQRGWGLGGEDG